MTLQRTHIKKEKKNEWVGFALTMVGIFLFFKFFVFHGVVPTESMVPTIPVNSHFIGLPAAYWFGEPEKEDVVYFSQDVVTEDGVAVPTLLTKRVAATEGQVVLIYGDDKDPSVQVYENLAEYNDDTSKPAGKSLEVPKDSYFMLGDNHQKSYDSRFWANPFVHNKDIKGKVWLGFKYKGGFKAWGVE